MVCKIINDEKVNIQKQLELIEKQLNDLPNGKLVICHDSKHAKYYQSFGNERVYIPKKKRFLAEQLARKRYLLLLKQELEQKLQIIDNYLYDYSKLNEDIKIDSEKFLLLVPEFSEKILIQNKNFPITLTKNNKTIDKILIDNWLKEPYRSNKKSGKSIIGNILDLWIIVNMLAKH